MSDRASDSAVSVDQAWLSTIAEEIPLGAVHVFDKDLKYVFNAGDGLRRWGVTSQALSNRSIREVLDDKLSEQIERNLGRVLKGESLTFEGEYGGEHYLSRVVPVLNPSDGNTYLIVHSLNVSRIENSLVLRREPDPEPKNKSQSSRPEEERQQFSPTETFMRQVQGPMYIFDRGGQIVGTNSALRQLFGYGEEDSFSGNVSELHPSLDAEAMSQKVAQVPSGGSCKFDLPAKRRDGHIFETEVELIAGAFHHSDLIVGLVKVNRDSVGKMTGPWETVEGLRLLLEDVTDLVVIADVDGKPVYMNPAFKSIFKGVTSVEGKSIVELVHHEDREKVVDLLKRTINSAGGQKSEFRFSIGEGNTRFVEARIEILRASGHEPPDLMLVCRDTTDSKKLEEQFLRAQRLESLGTLASGISHDLNNVLTPVILGVAALDRALTDERSRAILKMIESSLSRGRDIVKQVLTFARGVEGEHMMVQPRHIIHEAVALMRATFSKSISIVEATPQTLWLINGDVTRLTQLLMNLGVNARDAMPDGGTLNITAENVFVDNELASARKDMKPGRYVVIGMEDTGIGMTPQLMERIFEPFFTTKESGKGSGLGLSIVRDIVNGHNGFIDLRSETGVGTTFRIYLPATDGETTLQADEWDGASPRGNGELVLVVDDELSVCQTTRQTLEAFGYRVLTANDGAEAVAIFADQGKEIALVLIDIMMPVMDGPRTIRALRRLNAGVKVIAISGLVNESHAALVGDLIPNAFIAKPYTVDKFLKTIDTVLSGKSGKP